MRGGTKKPRIGHDLLTALDVIAGEIESGKRKVIDYIHIGSASRVVPPHRDLKSPPENLAVSSGIVLPPPVERKSPPETIQLSLSTPRANSTEYDNRATIHNGHESFGDLPRKIRELRAANDVFRVPRQLPKLLQKMIDEHVERYLR